MAPSPRDVALVAAGCVVGAGMAYYSSVQRAAGAPPATRSDEEQVPEAAHCDTPRPKTPQNDVLRTPGALSMLGARVSSDQDFISASQEEVFDRIRSGANEHDDAIVVGVAGGTGSGKTTLARAILDSLDCDVAYISHDNYYKDLAHLSLSEREKHNFDDPNALDTDLLFEDVMALKAGRDVDIPLYDFTTHTRKKETQRVKTQRIILVEGILIFTHENLRNAIDVKIFVDTADDVRLIRRLTRDVTERGRNVQSVINQYMATVRPMHELHVEPSKVHADVIIPVGINKVALDMILARLRESKDANSDA